MQYIDGNILHFSVAYTASTEIMKTYIQVFKMEIVFLPCCMEFETPKYLSHQELRKTKNFKVYANFPLLSVHKWKKKAFGEFFALTISF